MNKDHILGLYNDLSHFCQTGKLKQADYSGYSRELEIIVKNFRAIVIVQKTTMCLLLRIAE